MDIRLARSGRWSLVAGAVAAVAAPFIGTFLFRMQKDGSLALIAGEMLALAAVFVLLRFRAVAVGLVIGLAAHYALLWYLFHTFGTVAD